MTTPRALALALAALLLTGCGAGLDAQTYQDRVPAGSTDTSVGSLELRNISVLAPDEGSVFEVGDDAEVTLTIANLGTEDDRLVSVTTPAASEVVVLDEGEPGELEVPGLGSTEGEVTLLLRGLTAQLRTGEYLQMMFRFAGNGAVEALVPVELTGSTDRPIYTGEEGSEEGEPALGGPTGGHGEDHSAE